jgi:outer membrane protein TolC
MQTAAEPVAGILTIAGRTYRVQLLEEVPPADNALQRVKVAGGESSISSSFELPAAPDARAVGDSSDAETFDVQLVDERPFVEPIQLNLPTALSMVGGEHPAVGFAQWRVQEAYATLDRSKVLWLPSIQPGFSFHKHDGNYQASNAAIVDVHRNSFQYGLGAGATGAGTTPRPGVVARFHLADAIFQPKIDEKTAWARGHAANGVVNQQLLKVAISYLDLLDAEQDARIIEETQERTAGLLKLTRDFAATGQGLQADADRMQTESILVESRLVSARERIDVAAAKLAEALSIDAERRIVLLDPTVLPIELVSPELDKPTLIRTGLANRPELMEAQSLVAAACEQYNRQKYAPFVPSVLLGFSNGGFGGGQGNNLNNVQGRYDFDALLTWEIRNLGFGEGAARRETQARIQQARFEKVRMLDKVAREIVQAHAQVTHRAKQIDITQHAIESAENSYKRNLSRIRDAQGLPLEVLQSIRALEEARRAYLKAVIEYDQAQFQLQWALGWPVAIPADAG